MILEHYQTVDTHARAPQVASGLIGIRQLIINYKFQFQNFTKPSKFLISLYFTNLSRKKLLLPNKSKNHPKIHKILHNTDSRYDDPREFLDCLKRERDISIKAMSSGVKVAFRCNSHLIEMFYKN